MQRIIIPFLLLLVAVLSGCGGAIAPVGSTLSGLARVQETPARRITWMVPVTPTPLRLPVRPTRTPTPPSASSTVIHDDDFEDGSPGAWRTGETATGSAQVRDGALVLSVISPTTFLNSYPQDVTDLADASITATVRIDGPTGRAGVFARFDDPNSGHWTMYFCWIGDAALWACGKVIADSMEYLDFGRLANYNQDADNEIALRMVGDQMTFGINGDTLSFADAALARGSWGVWVWGSTTPATAYFDRITISSAGD